MHNVTHFKILNDERDGRPWLAVWHDDEREPTQEQILAEIDKIYED